MVQTSDRYLLDAYVNKKTVAARHRGLLLAVLAIVACFFLRPLILIAPFPYVVNRIAYYCFLGAFYWIPIQTGRLKYALEENLFMSVLYGVFALIPIINLITVYFVHLEASALLSRAGLRIGFLGVSARNYNRFFSPWLCKRCDYDLTGNRSGICAECGSKVPADTLQVLKQRESEMSGANIR